MQLRRSIPVMPEFAYAGAMVTSILKLLVKLIRIFIDSVADHQVR